MQRPLQALISCLLCSPTYTMRQSISQITHCATRRSGPGGVNHNACAKRADKGQRRGGEHHYAEAADEGLIDRLFERAALRW
jgi:hypothetical protein